MFLRLLALTGGALSAATTACGGRSSPPVPAPEPEPAHTVTAPVFVPIPDANTLAIVRMANNVEVAYAIIAARRARTSSVKTLLRRERTSHTALNTAVDRLAEQIGIEPREGDVSQLLYEQSLPRRDSLRTLSGRRFDSAYVDLEVRSHRELIVAIDSVFLRSVQDPRLESYLTDSLRPAVSAHLAQAERLQSTLAPRQ
jgi:predicted outer membrane protein